MYGFDFALREITLVFFTTLAPAGVVAYILLSILPVCINEDSKCVDKYLIVPFSCVLLGLVVSATHLGNPDNALFVFSRIGSSPLSNEVASAVVFLGFASVHWLYQFALHVKPLLYKCLRVLALLFAFVFLYFVSQAYVARTISTWDTVYASALIISCACVAGPMIMSALLEYVFDAAHMRSIQKKLCLLSAMAFVITTVLYCVQFVALNNLGVLESVRCNPFNGYWVFLFLFVLSFIAAVGLFIYIVKSENKHVYLMIGVAALCLLGVFFLRFQFYMMHVTCLNIF